MSLALLRIEHKLDLVLHALKARDPVLRELLDDIRTGPLYAGDTCPVCEVPVVVSIDPAAESYVRTCACRPPVTIVTGISSLLQAPPRTQRTPETEQQPEESSHAEEQSTRRS